MRKYRRWLEPFDPDLHLKEVRDDPDQSWTRRALAGASIGTPPAEGFQKCDELLNAILMICGRVEAGRASLAEILSAQGDDYQRCLWFTLAGRDPWSYYFDLQWLVAAMQKRLVLATEAQAKGYKIVAMRPPYAIAQPDGPQGIFSPEFSLSLLWEGFI